VGNTILALTISTYFFIRPKLCQSHNIGPLPLGSRSGRPIPVCSYVSVPRIEIQGRPNGGGRSYGGGTGCTKTLGAGGNCALGVIRLVIHAMVLVTEETSMLRTYRPCSIIS
jgi:hypothetical protein